MAKKYKTQGSVSYPHIGRFLSQYFAKYGVNRAAVARELDVAHITTTGYMARSSFNLVFSGKSRWL